MERTIAHLSLKFTQLQNSDWISFNEIKEKKKVMGVYMIYSNTEELLYVGNTNDFNVRFGTDMRHEATHTLIRKMLKTGVYPNRPTAAYHFTNHYKYKIMVCANKREAEALEHIAIWILDPKYNSHPFPEVTTEQ